MKKGLLIGTELDVHGLPLTVDAVEYASRANAILGIRDSGKTYTGTMIAEQLYDCGIPFFAFDPIGRWRFLKSPAPEGRGFPIVVAGGRAPDLPLSTENASKLVEAAMKSGVSMVIDLYSVDLSKADWRKIVRASIETILYKGEGHGLRHVFLEEAAEFIPQRVTDGVTYAAVEKLARMGGNVGVGVTLINQRAEEVNKAVLELCDNLLLHRQRGKNSLKSLGKWLDAANVKPPREITDSLADLPTGQCWAWFKDVGRPKLIKVTKKLSFDANRRAMASAGAAPAPVKIDEFVERMKVALAGKTVPRSEEQPSKKEGDVKESEARALRADNERLTKEVEELRRRLAALTAAAPAPVNGRTFESSSAGPDDLYDDFKRRLLADADPKVIALLTQRPEIEVRVQRKVVRVDGSTLKGRIAKLIADGFYDSPRSNNATTNELKRVGGVGVNFGNLAREMKALASDGFLTVEADGYQVVTGMKVNVIED